MAESFEDKKRILREQAEARLQEASRPVEDLSLEELKTLIHDYQVHQIELEMQNEELRDTQRQLTAARNRFAELFNEAPVGYLILDENAFIVQANQTFALMVGKELDQLHGRALADFIVPADRSAFHGRFKAFFKNPSGKQLDFRLLDKKNEVPVRCVGRPDHEMLPRSGQDDRKQLLLVINDISEQVRSEKALRESEERYRLLSDLTMEGIVIHKDGVVRDLNISLARLLGYEREELIGGNIVEFAVHEDDRTRVRESVLQEYSGPYAVRGVNKNGETFFVEIEARNFKTQGETLRVAAVRDITERKRIEDALRQSHERLMTVLNSIDAFIYIVAMDTYEVLFCNEYGREVWGDLTGTTCWQTIQQDQDGPCSFCTNDKLLDASGKPTGVHAWEFQNTKTGRWFDCRDQAITWTDGRIVRLEIATDITERKRAQEKIVKINEKLQKLLREKDTFFSIIAHDLRSPISGFLSLTRAFAEDAEIWEAEDVRGASQALYRSAEQLYALLENLLHWARMQQGSAEFAPKPHGLQQIIGANVDFLHLMAQQKEVSLEMHIPEGLTALIDPAMIGTVIRNLLSNAVKFSNRGGRVRVTAAREGSMVHVSVQDNGMGMDEQTLSGLFRLDRKVSKLGTEGESSTGLGLILCKEFTDRHGGYIWAESTPGQGTTFHFTLPAIEE